MTSEFDAAMGLVFLESAEIWTRDVRRALHRRVSCGPGQVPASLQAASSSENLSGGLVQEDARVGDSTGRFVVQSRQLCGVRIPAGHPPR